MGFDYKSAAFLRRMPWFLQYFLLLVPLAMSMVSVVNSGRKLPPIYWNSTNSMFYSSNMNNEIDINLGDTIDIICPQYGPDIDPKDMEYYVIYMVNETAYNSCIINNSSLYMMLVNCSYPKYNLVYTLLIKQFQSIPRNPDFQPGGKYYFITTSGGAVHEIDNQFEGACREKNMRITLNVCCEKDRTPRPPRGNRTTTQPVHRTTTPRPRVTTRKQRTTQSTTIKPTTTTTMRRTTPRTDYPIRTDTIPGKGPNQNVIHVTGPKNVGLISDNGGHRTLLSVALLLVTVCLAHLFR